MTSGPDSLLTRNEVLQQSARLGEVVEDAALQLQEALADMLTDDALYELDAPAKTIPILCSSFSAQPVSVGALSEIMLTSFSFQ